jgi:hypothetical protein
MLDFSPSMGAAMNRYSGADATMAKVIEFRRSSGLSYK